MYNAELWVFREACTGNAERTPDVTGYSVEAIDGTIGKVDQATYEPGSSSLVVDTGLLFRKKTLLPAGVVKEIDTDEQVIHVYRTREQIRSCPGPEDAFCDDSHRASVAAYYGLGGPGYRDWKA